MTEATKQTLVGLRDLSTLQWYAIPILAIVFYVYTIEMKKARESRNWDGVFAALAIFGALIIIVGVYPDFVRQMLVVAAK